MSKVTKLYLLITLIKVLITLLTKSHDPLSMVVNTAAPGLECRAELVGNPLADAFKCRCL